MERVHPKAKGYFLRRVFPIFIFSHAARCGVELRRRRQEDSELQANLDYIVRIETLRSV